MPNEQIRFGESCQRLAWTQDDLHAYKHKRCYYHGKFIVVKDYYVKSKGER